MIKLLIGNEPYLIADFKKKILDGLELTEFNYRQSTVCGPEELMFAQTMPFLSSRKVLFLNLENFAEAEFMISYFKDPAETTDLIITGKVDKRSKLFKLFRDNGWIEEYNKVSDSILHRFIQSIIKHHSGAITESAFQLLLSRINYQGDENCSLYTVKTCVQQVLFFNPKITNETVEAVLEKTIEDDIFSLSKHLFNNDRTSLFELADHLLETKESPIAMLSLLIRNFRLTYKASLIGDSKKAAIEIGVPAYQLYQCNASPATVSSCLTLLQDGIRRIKSGSNAEGVFKLVLAELAEALTKS